MSVERFLDTNLFIYQLDTSDERKSSISNRIIREGIETGNACISFQVVQECLNTVVRKAEIPLDSDSALIYLETVLSPLLQIQASISLYRHGLDIQKRYRFSFYDSLIVAAALEGNCTKLFSEDMQHGQQIGVLTIVNPFNED